MTRSARLHSSVANKYDEGKLTMRTIGGELFLIAVLMLLLCAAYVKVQERSGTPLQIWKISEVTFNPGVIRVFKFQSGRTMQCIALYERYVSQINHGDTATATSLGQVPCE
jgi:hypothetical protein